MATIGILFLGRKRPGFDLEWGAHIQRCAKNSLKAFAQHTVVHEASANDENSLATALADFRSAGVEVPVVLQPTMSDGRLAPRLAQLWNGAVVLWATPEKQDSPAVSSCSLVGAHVFAANLRQLQRPFEFVYGMPGDDATDEELCVAVQVAAAHSALQRTKIGLVGYHAPGFIDMHADPFDLSRQFGVELFHTSVQDLIDRIGTISKTDINTDVESLLALGLPIDGVSPEDLAAASRSYLAIRDLMKEESLNALALREWPEIPNLTGHWPYLSISRLLNEGVPISCEGDVDGALTSQMGCLLGCGPGYLTDWLEHDTRTITLWHGGCAPFAMCEPIGSEQGPRIGLHFNTAKPSVVNAVLKAEQPVTLCRVWRCDGEYWVMFEEAETTAPKRMLKGTVGTVVIEDYDVCDWFRNLIFAGMPHHLVVFPGWQADLLARLAQLLMLNIF